MLKLAAVTGLPFVVNCMIVDLRLFKYTTT